MTVTVAPPEGVVHDKKTVVQVVFLMADYHAALRREKRYPEADRVRDALIDMGFEVASMFNGETQFYSKIGTWKKLTEVFLSDRVGEWIKGEFHDRPV